MSNHILSKRKDKKMKNDVIRARINTESKEIFEKILEQLGVTTSDAINMFVRQVILRKGLPFEVSIPNATTIAAVEELKHSETLSSYSSFSEMVEALKEEAGSGECQKKHSPHKRKSSLPTNSRRILSPT